MAIIDNSTYNPKYFFKGKHFNTVYRTFFKNVKVNYSRKRYHTKDNDFLDLDFLNTNSNSSEITIIIHGLEGNSDSTYVKSLAKVLIENKIDVLALNLRGCSGEPNKLMKSYHSGKTDDLAEIIEHLENQYNYTQIHIVGFSLGGNMTLKYMGENGNNLPKIVKSAVAVSVPCDLKGSSESISAFWNTGYMQRFLVTLKKKCHQKLKQFPDSFLDAERINSVKNFYDFDNLYTAPAHGFKDAHDYWEKNSSKQFLPYIKTPTLLITAMDDPFLSKSCIPTEEAKNNDDFYLEVTKYGGHVGFNSSQSNDDGMWLERRIVQFIQNKK